MPETVGELIGFDDAKALKKENPDAIIDSIAHLDEILNFIDKIETVWLYRPIYTTLEHPIRLDPVPVLFLQNSILNLV